MYRSRNFRQMIGSAAASRYCSSVLERRSTLAFWMGAKYFNEAGRKRLGRQARNYTEVLIERLNTHKRRSKQMQSAVHE